MKIQRGEKIKSRENSIIKSLMTSWWTVTSFYFGTGRYGTLVNASQWITVGPSQRLVAPSWDLAWTLDA